MGSQSEEQKEQYGWQVNSEGRWTPNEIRE